MTYSDFIDEQGGHNVDPHNFFLIRFFGLLLKCILKCEFGSVKHFPFIIAKPQVTSRCAGNEREKISLDKKPLDRLGEFRIGCFSLLVSITVCEV